MCKHKYTVMSAVHVTADSLEDANAIVAAALDSIKNRALIQDHSTLATITNAATIKTVEHLNRLDESAECEASA